MWVPQDCAHNVSVWAVNNLTVRASVAAAAEFVAALLLCEAAEEALCAGTLAEVAG